MKTHYRAVFLSIMPLLVFSQSDLPFCLGDSTFRWTYNSVGDSPCEVMNDLVRVCLPGSYYPALGVGDDYLVPLGIESQAACICNSVFYSMSSACAYCQDRTWKTWSDFSQNCSTVYVQNFPYPIPGQTRIPTWAYVDVKTVFQFSPDIGKIIDASGLPDSAAVPSATGTGTKTPARTATHTPTPNAVSAHHKKSNTGAIAGGVVGGSAILCIVAGVLYCRGRGRKKAQAMPSTVEEAHEPSSLVQDTQKPISLMQEVTVHKPTFEASSVDPVKQYDPDDPSTYPLLSSPNGTPMTSGTSTTLPTPPMYSGAPEPH
ncbi:hypothetical protein BJ165DRAFT_1591235 [Panaeolus papilionaceus]|nr:hypothetical protein BJ165DRAFT_1591235 [Panaeolus papilionaceus]